MSKTIDTRIRHKKDTSANWESNNPVLLENELILVEMNDGEIRIKIGDGISAYSDLPFSYFGSAQAKHSHLDIERILKDGLTNGKKTVSADGTVITTIDSMGRTLVKTFTNNFLTSTSILYDENGLNIGEMVREFSEDGSEINTTVTYDDGYIIVDQTYALLTDVVTDKKYKVFVSNGKLSMEVVE